MQYLKRVSVSNAIVSVRNAIIFLALVVKSCRVPAGHEILLLQHPLDCTTKERIFIITKRHLSAYLISQHPFHFNNTLCVAIKRPVGKIFEQQHPLDEKHTAKGFCLVLKGQKGA